MVIDFAVESQDRIAIIANKRLVSAYEIDDSEAHGAQRHICGFIHTLLIRAAVYERANRPFDTSGFYLTVFMRETRDSTQCSSPLRTK
jgi:hypothetical protein